ncbi:protein RRP5 homolog isoform X1 [Argiope bruennichi]|nr:protein RRP5 homolog isoform X1 [Argiope bruennichi]
MNMIDFDPSSPEYAEMKSFSEVESLIAKFPNSSKAWMLGAVNYLKYGDVNKAKVLLQRGIKTINFREDEEKLNLWKALMNLEAYHVSREALLATFEEALKYNDTRKVYLHMLQLLINTEKTEELEIFKDKILKKFKTDKEVYLTLCEYYMKHGAKKEGRSLFERSLQCVSPKEHPDILGKFANLEYKYGDIERSLNLYEEILVKYPKRKDLKSIYIQVLKSQGQEERANSLL